MPTIVPAAIPVPDDHDLLDAAEESRQHKSRVAEAWRIAMAHMQLGEIPIEQLDIADPLPTAAADESKRERTDERDPSATDAAIDESIDESFPASDPPSTSKSHA